MREPQVMHEVLALVLAGGRGQRLWPLTAHRAKPAVHFGGVYRLIDFTMSNAINSGIRQMLVLVQYKSYSLSRHLRQAWNVVHTELGEFIDIVPPQKRVSESWYLGTADAIYQNIYSIEAIAPRHVLILSSDHIYKMNYKRMIDFHRRSGADLTVATIMVPLQEATRFGVLEVDTDLRVIGFDEKPAHPKEMPGHPGAAVASMGVYCFNTEVLVEACQEDAEQATSHDFGKDILPRLVESHQVFAYNFVDENRKQTQYWRDVGTIDSYFDANMDLTAIDPLFNLYDPEWPLRTHMPQLPPAKFAFEEWGQRFGAAVDSIVCPGCIVSGSLVRRSVISPDVRINSYADIQDCILMHNVEIGRHARLRNCIIDKNVSIPEGMVIGENPEEDAKKFYVSEGGVVVVTKSPEA